MILFKPRTEFLICKTERKAGGQLHVYLREIETGLAQNVILCTQERLDSSNAYFCQWMRDTLFDQFDQNYRVIVKQNSQTALAYLRSPFFYVAH